ncbi:[NiFe]-hydrogenase assembly chaperone HybE [Rhizobium sp. L1K21]|uniref:[NiFe]-hydrogenase assembly chaperone HybE n=1 Tax=Rhizobium sp. L1K21 TaxID=2954933 RepID=UPI00209270B9|nr:[NiFe]-hydrogenase assembly chaperone HybE [Rhizobium sp. L1K21]MCO6184614.1 [NiFe]-hydrogenase assembly chaperone HybE [Rhizobium sp. L1K21]
MPVEIEIDAQGIDALDAAANDIAVRLAARYRVIAETSMADVPICNPALDVAATGFRAYCGRAVGVVTTPWFMNLVAIALPGQELDRVVPGQTVRLCLPAGEVEFIVGALEGVGRVDSCSLFSPVFEFATMDEACAVAGEILHTFFDPQALEPPPPPPARPSRRDLLRGRLKTQPEEVEP